MTREFHIGDILSVTTDYLVSPSMIGGVYEILNHMTGEDLFTHQLPRAVKECRPHLLAQHPQLAGCDCSGLDAETVPTRLAELVAQFGETLPVTPLAAGEYQPRNPITELAEMTDKPIVVVATD